MIVTVAAGPYAHFAGLAAEGRGDGVDVRLEVREPGEIFRRMLQDAPWDMAEMSLATAYILADRSDRRFVPVPVFPSRAFRHAALFVPEAGGIDAAVQLRGRRIGVLRYAMTTAVWVRAMLAEQYGVPVDSLQWFVGEPSTHPPGVEPVVVEGMVALERMAADGAIDCLISGRTPGSFRQGKLRRLFRDFGAEEKAYYARSRVFPIMHVMVARRELAEDRPDVVRLMLERFERAGRAAQEGLRNFDISTYPLPWLPAYVEDAHRAMGEELWPYGVDANRATLEEFGRALARDGLAGRCLSPEEVFAGA